MKKLTSVIFVVIMLSMGCALNAKVNDANAAQAYHWYDGQQQRTLHLDDSLIADFNPQSESAAKAAKNTGLSADKTVGGARLWKLSTGTTATALTSVKAKNQSGSFSPVFRDAQASSRLMALPGNVIVQFASDWDEARIEQWVSDQGQAIDSKASFGINFYILKTPPGIASLQIANSLFETGEVLMASPNWWQQKYPK